jgi:hypothetical protein
MADQPTWLSGDVEEMNTKILQIHDAVGDKYG